MSANINGVMLQGFHWFLRSDFPVLLKLRKQFALGEERYYADRNVAGWVRMGFVPGAKGAMAVVINTAYGAVKAIQTILRLIATRYASSGRGYVYVSGAASLYPPGNADGKPQIVITDAKQLADFPPGE
jgi:hypothetical protein